MNFKNLLIIFIILVAFWLMLTLSFEPSMLLIGIGVSAFISLLFCNKCSLFAEMKLTPKSLGYTLAYLFVFLIELIKSNIDVIRRVLSPSLPINPGIVEVRTSLKSKFARMLLANSITLTPGTLTVEVQDESFFIHWIDVRDEDMEAASNEIVRKFEKYLEVIYG